MRHFSSRQYRLRDASIEVRVIYTGFLTLTLVGLLTLLAFQLIHIGPTPSRIVRYYCGGESGDEMTFPKTFRQLVEVTHFHSFVMGTIFLVLAHLFVATGVRARIKLALIASALAGILGDLVSPWLIRFVSGGFAYVQLISWLLLWTGFGAFVAAPVTEMWIRRTDARPGRGRRHRREPVTAAGQAENTGETQRKENGR